MEVKSWRDKEFICIIKRMSMSSFLKEYYTGYVGVPQEHPLFGLGYSNPRIDRLQVHGGLTYSDYMEGYPDYWFFGFDCAHSFDMDQISNGNYVSNKNIDFVINEIRTLVSYLRRWIQFC